MIHHSSDGTSIAIIDKTDSKALILWGSFQLDTCSIG